MKRVLIGGMTGRVGRGLVRALADDTEFQIVGGLARSSTTMDGLPVYGDLATALAVGADLWVDYTRADAVRTNVLRSIEHGLSVVIGTSGLSENDYVEIDRLAQRQRVGVFAAGNFSLTAALMKRFAVEAARWIAQWEILDASYDGKPDAPSGTSRELAAALADVRRAERTIALENTIGDRSSRGAEIAGSTVHSLRLPGYVSSCEIQFGMGHERLTLRHDSIDPTEPYVQGTILAMRYVRSYIGLRRGMDQLLTNEGTTKEER